MPDEPSFAFYETTLYFIPILVCDMESDYIFAEGVFPSVYNMVPLYIIRDFFFGNMFDASWFLGALLVGVPMVWGLSRLFMKDVLVILLPLLVYLFLYYVKELPSEWTVLYNWYNDFKSPNLSFPGGLLWITLGYVMANKSIITWMEKVRNGVAWVAVLLFLILSFFIQYSVNSYVID